MADSRKRVDKNLCRKIQGVTEEGNTCLQTPGTCESCPLWHQKRTVKTFVSDRAQCESCGKSTAKRKGKAPAPITLLLGKVHTSLCMACAKKTSAVLDAAIMKIEAKAAMSKAADPVAERARAYVDEHITLEAGDSRDRGIVSIYIDGKLICHTNGDDANVIKWRIRDLAAAFAMSELRRLGASGVDADLRADVKSLLEIGKRDLTNPKYDGYFESLRKHIALPGAPAEQDNG